MSEVDTSKEAVETWCNSRGVIITKPPKTPPEVEMLRALVAERDTLQAQLNSTAHAAKVLLDVYNEASQDGCNLRMMAFGAEVNREPWELSLVQALRAIALDTTTATCDNTREGE